MRHTEPDQRVTFRAVLANREFRALYLAQTLSVTGDQLARIAVGVMIFDRTGSSALTGVSYAISYLPWLIGGPTLSVLADRHSRRSVMIACDAIRTALVVSLTLGVMTTPVVLCSVCLVALAEPPFASARAALIPDVVGEGRSFAAASTLGNATSQLAVVVGFAGGGAITEAFGVDFTLAIDAATFALSGAVSSIVVTHRPPARGSHRSWREDMREGAAVVFGTRSLRWLVTTSWLVVGAAIMTEAAAVPYAKDHGGGALAAGFLTAALPFGMTLGALALGRLTNDALEPILPALALLSPAALSLTALGPSPVGAGIIWLVAGILSAMTVAANRIFVSTVGSEVRGRAFGIASAGISTAQGLGSLMVGLLCRPLGPSGAIGALSLATFAGVATLTAGRRSAETVSAYAASGTCN